MFLITEADADAIRAIFNQEGESLPPPPCPVIQLRPSGTSRTSPTSPETPPTEAAR
jgi:hypothetical protein